MNSHAQAASAGASGALRHLEIARGMVITCGPLEPEQASSALHSAPGLLRVVHVQRGCCVVVLSDGSREELGEGGVALLGPSVDCLGTEMRWGSVAGLVLAVDGRRLPADIRRVFSSFEVNLEAIARLVPAERPIAVARANTELARVFAETYPLVGEGNVGCLRLKAIEVLRCLTTLAGACSHGCGGQRRSSARVRHVQVALRAQQEMIRDVSRPKTIPTLAAICGTSPTVLKEAFRETFGVPIYTWYREYRVRLAAEALLESDLPIAEVAASVGYSSPSKFTKAFSDTMGTTPREWRAAGGVSDARPPLQAHHSRDSFAPGMRGRRP
ncbi:MAG: AraC family transcriptional regulator [Olsenella sp.]|nr:AraC family transcriptional regulator [Olsenella sp.]MCI1810697.1 AraC family transcriptional regulator [Olsenella sp.]